MEETEIQELTDTCAAEFPEKDFEHLTLLSEPDDDKDSVAVMERPQLTTHVLKNGLQMVDEFVDNFFCRNVTIVNGEELL